MAKALLLSTVNKALAWTPEGAQTIHEGMGSYSSSTWNEENIFVTTQNRGSRGELKDNLLLIFDGKLELVDMREFPNVGPTAVMSVHEIFWWDGKLYIVSTANSRVVSWEPSGYMELIYQSPPRKPDKWSKNRGAHLNSVWCDGESFYVVEHRHGPSRVVRFDLDWNWRNTYHIGHQSHNIYLENGVMYVNTSWHHAVAIRDMRKGGERWVKIGEQLTWKPEEHSEEYVHEAYPRGLARTKDRWYVGLSATLKRGDRTEGDSCVAVFDNDWKLVDEIVVPDTGGIGTGGVRVVGETDYAHNRIPCPWDGKLK